MAIEADWTAYKVEHTGMNWNDCRFCYYAKLKSGEWIDGKRLKRGLLIGNHNTRETVRFDHENATIYIDHENEATKRLKRILAEKTTGHVTENK